MPTLSLNPDIAFLLDVALCLPVPLPDLLMCGLKRREVRATQRLGQPVQGMLAVNFSVFTELLAAAYYGFGIFRVFNLHYFAVSPLIELQIVGLEPWNWCGGWGFDITDATLYVLAP